MAARLFNSQKIHIPVPRRLIQRSTAGHDARFWSMQQPGLTVDEFVAAPQRRRENGQKNRLGARGAVFLTFFRSSATDYGEKRENGQQNGSAATGRVFLTLFDGPPLRGGCGTFNLTHRKRARALPNRE
jgi:hypothetical protein